MNARRLLATSLLILSAALAACGGDNDPAGEPPTTSPPEPADTRPSSPEEGSFPASFVKQVEEVCVPAQRKLDNLAPIEDEKGLDQAVQVYENTESELRGLKPPAENAEAYDRFVEVYGDAASTLDGILGEVKRGDTSAFQRVQPTLDNVATEGGDAAEDYGFTKCVSG